MLVPWYPYFIILTKRIKKGVHLTLLKLSSDKGELNRRLIMSGGVNVKFICSRIKKRRKPRVKIVTLKLC